MTTVIIEHDPVIFGPIHSYYGFFGRKGQACVRKVTHQSAVFLQMQYMEPVFLGGISSFCPSLSLLLFSLNANMSYPCLHSFQEFLIRYLI